MRSLKRLWRKQKVKLILLNKQLLALLLLMNCFLGLVAQDSNSTYQQRIEFVQHQRPLLKAIFVKKERELATSLMLTRVLKDSIFPAWYGTPWDFNGISNKPKKGKIACGYFVSTTLKHVGFNLNRYKVAQQAAAVIIDEICGKTFVTKFHNADSMKAYVLKQPEGLYVLGLDFHVGFILHEKGKVFFIHSDYFNGKVVREPALNAQALTGSGGFVLGKLSGNTALMNKWLNQTRIYK